MAYDGNVVTYATSSPDTIIYITVTGNEVIKASLVKTATSTTLNINPLSPSYFASLRYATY